MTSSPRSGLSYEPRRPRNNQWQPGEEIPVHPRSSRPARGTLSFDNSLEDDEPQQQPPNLYVQLWEDVQSLIRASNESFEARWSEVSCRMQQMEEKLDSLQTQISEHSETPSSSDSSSTSSSRRRKRKTPVSFHCRYILLIHKPGFVGF